MPRTILIHLNAQAADDDPRSEEEISRDILSYIANGLDSFSWASARLDKLAAGHAITRAGVALSCPLHEEV